MENLIYLGKVSLLITLFWLMYNFLLQKESFKTFNRWFLLMGIGISFLLPVLIFTKTIEIPTSQVSFSEVESLYLPASSNQIQAELKKSFDPAVLIWSLYLIGGGIMTIKFMLQLVALRKLILQCDSQQMDGITHYHSPSPIASFSFFNAMVYHKESHKPSSLQMIITHEKAHIKGHHSIDLVIGNLLQIVVWFLPFAYFYRKSMIENLEFLADATTLAEVNDKKQYQYTLLQCASGQQSQLLGNFFFSYSSLKKRIMNMNQKQSAHTKKLKSIFILPMLVAFVMLFQIETVAMQVPSKEVKVTSVRYEEEANQTKDSVYTEATVTAIEATITKTSTDKELEELAKSFKEIMDVDVNISKVKRNKKGEITRIHIKVEDKKANLVSEQKVESTSGIDPLLVYRKKSEKSDVLAVANEAIIKNKKENENSSESLSGIVKNKEAVYFNGKKLDLSKKNVFVDYEIEKNEGSSIYLTGEYLDAYDDLKTVLKEVMKENGSFYVLGKSLLNQKDNDILVMHVRNHNTSNDNGGINVLDKEIDASQHSNNSKKTTTVNYYEAPKSPASINLVSESNVVYIVNGEEVSTEIMRAIKPTEIESINVIKDEAEIKKLTDKDVDGVVEITLKKLSASTPPPPPAPHSPSPPQVFVIEEEDVEEIEIGDFEVIEVSSDQATRSILRKDAIEINAEFIEIGDMKLHGNANYSNGKNEAKKVLYFIDGKKVSDKKMKKLSDEKFRFKKAMIIEDKDEVKAYTKEEVDSVILLFTK